MFVLLAILVAIFRIRGGKPSSTITDGTGHEGQSLTGTNEDIIVKDQLQRTTKLDDSHF